MHETNKLSQFTDIHQVDYIYLFNFVIMSPTGYYTAAYESARNSSKSKKKTKRASRRPEREEKRQASRSESRHEDRNKHAKKQSVVASNDANKQRRTDAIGVKQPESSKVERRDA